MSKLISILILLLALPKPLEAKDMAKIKLPAPQSKSSKTLPEILNLRTSVRNFAIKPLNQQQISYILWSANGLKLNAVSSTIRTIPSAGAIYPLEVYLVVGKNKLEGVTCGLYHYRPTEHSLELADSGDKREELARACLEQHFVSQAPVSIIIAAVYKRTTDHYGQRGRRYVDIEVGHSSQNIYLAVTDSDLITVEVGAFDDDKLKQLLKFDKEIQPLAVMPVGYKK